MTRVSSLQSTVVVTKVKPLLAPLAAIVSILLLNGSIFRNTFLGLKQYIGDSDRLNTFLNIRYAAIREILESGRAMAWNENMFMGFNTAGLHWINPIADPMGYLLASLQPSDPLHAMTVLSALQLLATGLFAYLFVYDVVPSRIPAVVGSLLYSLSVFSVQRVSQADTSHVVMVLLPLVMYLVNKCAADKIRWTFLSLVLTLSVLLWFSFLQDLAYALFLTGLYTVYLTYTAKDWRYLFVVMLAGLLAIVISFPRIYTISLEMPLLVRTSAFNTTDSMEALRFLNDGIFGRDFAEARAFGNGLNIREGLQLLHSSTAVVVALAGLACTLSFMRKAALSIVLTAMIAFTFLPKLTLGLIALIALLELIRWRGSRGWQRWRLSAGQPSPWTDDPQALFGALVLIFVLIVVLTPMRHVIYLLFMRQDFTHSRLSIMAILPLATMTASHLHALAHQDDRHVCKHLLVVTAAGISAVLFMLWLQSDAIQERFPGAIAIRNGYSVLKAEAFRTTMTIIVAILLFRTARKAQALHFRAFARSALVALIITETFLHADFRVNGAQTNTYPVPFADGNFFTAPRETFIAPSKEARDLVSAILENDKFRSAAVINPSEFPAYGGVVPHLGEVWGLRFAEGYSTGVPLRLAALPWSGSAMALRAITFAADTRLPAALLAILNVKYFLRVTPALYFNTLGTDLSPDSLVRTENPYPVLPRQFFVENLQSWPPGVANLSTYTEFLNELRRRKESGPLVPPGGPPSLLDMITVPTSNRPADGPIAVTNQDGAILAWPLMPAHATVQIDRRIDGPADQAHIRYILNDASSGRPAAIPVNQSGRFVRVQTTGHHHSLFTEIEVRGCQHGKPCDAAKLDLASGKRVRQSNSAWTFWREIDLGEEQSIDDIILRRSGRTGEMLVHENVSIFISSAPLPIERPPDIEAKSLPSLDFVRLAEVPVSERHYVDRTFPSLMRGAYRLTLCENHHCKEWATLAVSDHNGKITGRQGEFFGPVAQETILELPNGNVMKGRADPQKLIGLSYVDGPDIVEKYLHGRVKYSTAGSIKARYSGERIHIEVDSAKDDRVLVLNELYHPSWHAYAGGQELPVFPVNIVMRGLLVPSGTRDIDMIFSPFSTSLRGLMLTTLGILLVGPGLLAMRRIERRHPSWSQSDRPSQVHANKMEEL